LFPEKPEKGGALQSASFFYNTANVKGSQAGYRNHFRQKEQHKDLN